VATKVQIRSTLGGTNTNTCRDTWWLVAYQTTFALRHLKYSLHLGDIPPGEKHDDVGNTRGREGQQRASHESGVFLSLRASRFARFAVSAQRSRA
jgi:hypothetical protein